MNIPKSQNLHSQSFNSKFVEFVWRFTENENTFQVIFISLFGGLIYHEYGYVDTDGEYVGKFAATSAAISNGHLSADELQSLHSEVIEYLK